MQPVDYPKSLMQVTAEKIRQAIVSGELSLGSKLSEQRLADTLGVSRSPVRDALAALAWEDLVTISPKRGTFVFTPDLRAVDELCEHRVILETSAIRLGIERNQEALMRRLEKSCDEMQSALDANDPHRYTLADHEFHNSIIECAANRTLTKSYNLTISPLKALRTHLFTVMSENTERSLSEHVAVFDAVRGTDPELAASLLGDHVGHLAKAYRTKLFSEERTHVQRANSRYCL